MEILDFYFPSNSAGMLGIGIGAIVIYVVIFLALMLGSRQ